MNRYPFRLSLLLINIIPVIGLCGIMGCDFTQHPVDSMPYKTIKNLTGKMLYERGDYYYKRATTTHEWQGLPETDVAELQQAGVYYAKALAKGYRPKNGYDRLLKCYMEEADEKKREADFTSLIQAFPDSAKYWDSRAQLRREYKNYRGALQDLDQVIKIEHNFEALKDAYYLRGAIKYILSPKDTTEAEADRQIAIKIAKTYGTKHTYYVFCLIQNSDIQPYGKGVSDDDELKKDVEKYTTLIKARPDSLQYWYERALSMLQIRNYKGALADFNKVLNAEGDHKDINDPYYKKLEHIYNIDAEDAYYMRGASKYRLTPKDTTEAEADRQRAIQLHRNKANLLTYKDYCNSSYWK